MDKSEMPKRIFWWTLFFLFWITSATVIGYAFGYRFSFERGIFVYAGSISLKTTPQTTNVYINNVLYSSKSLSLINNSYHIGGIIPGTYNVEVSAPGYATWSKKVTVHSGISTEFWNIVLAKDGYLQTDYGTSGVRRFFVSPRKNITAVAEQNEDAFSVQTVTATDKTTEEVFFSQEYSFTNDDKENIEWTPQSHRIIIPTVKNDTQEKTYFIADVPSNQVLNLKDIAGTTDLSHVRWDPKTRNALFYMSGGNLFRVDLDSPTEIVEVAKNIASYELTSSNLYYFQLPEGIVYKTNFAGTDTSQQLTRTAPADMSDPSYQIIVYDDDRITFLNNNTHHLYIYNVGEIDDYFQELSSNALGSQFSDDGKKLLFWNDHEIFTYFARKWDVQPQRVENEMTPITRYTDPIQNVQWSRDYEHVIFTVDKKMKFIEIDQRDHRNLMDLLTLNSDNARVINNNSDGLIYLSDSDQNGNMTLRTIEFPEKTTILQNFGFGATAPAPTQTD